ncbi:unnamed protein product [Bemisia tabaci]|uniref:Peptidase C1A papain C-terminal domain-containing protein n=1 Tax=Bemisia tabaci TaxID=7038 RepID=A0A9P0F600_BEMTA|nr:unnamed protein product [Bemisia tabaci]
MMWLKLVFLFLMTLVSIEMSHISDLLNTHPTWSFELESVESLIKRGMSELRRIHPDVEISENILRTKIAKHFGPGTTHVARKTGDPKWPERVPQSFDSRDHFKECAHLIEDIEDEGPCYNEVHVMVSSVASDRYCIYTNATFRDHLSSEYLTGCYSSCTRHQYIYPTWKKVVQVGVPSGGKYHSNKGCLPYEHAPCKHTANDYTARLTTKTERSVQKGGGLKSCDEYMAYDHDCPTKCSNSKYPVRLEDDMKKMTTYYQLSRFEYQIRNDIYAYGPAVSDIFLYSDFFDYKSGLYNKSTNAALLSYNKLIKLIGWGTTEDGTPYWLAMNEWAGWADDKKVFKFPRGVDFLWAESFTSTGVYDPL